ncbi:MAG: hypothetical protein GY868_21685 [Deltaproteobacteria bacterium]|nr:hypothetical protein [Deltaproteobacteria bacterium]
MPQIQISVYDNKVIIWNNGRLPDDWTVERLFAKHASHPFNPDIANAFFRAGMIETWGRGIKKMQAACRKRKVPEPVLLYETTGLWVRFETGAAAPVTAPVNEYVLRLLKVLERQQALSNSDICQQLGLRSRRRTRETYIKPTLNAGLIEHTIPDKPRSRLQKYQLTNTGRAALQARPMGPNRGEVETKSQTGALVLFYLLKQKRPPAAKKAVAPL